MNDHRRLEPTSSSILQRGNGFKARPAAPPPPPPTTRNTTLGEGAAAAPIHESQAHLPGRRSSEYTSGVNARIHRSSSSSCNGHPASSKASHLKSQPAKAASTYEVYHINHHHTVGIPYPTATSAALTARCQSSYCYFPHAPHSISSNSTAISKAQSITNRNLEASPDLSQGSCDNAPATPDSLDSLGSELEGISDSAVSSPFQRLQSDDYEETTTTAGSDRLQCTSSVLSPLSLEDSDHHQTGIHFACHLNNNTIKRSPKDKDCLLLKSNSSSPMDDNLNMEADAASSPEADSSGSSHGCHPSMSSSLTPSTVVATVTVASSLSPNTTVRGQPASPPTSHRYKHFIQKITH